MTNDPDEDVISENDFRNRKIKDSLVKSNVIDSRRQSRFDRSRLDHRDSIFSCNSEGSNSDDDGDVQVPKKSHLARL